MKQILSIVIAILSFPGFAAAQDQFRTVSDSSTREMVQVLELMHEKAYSAYNPFASKARLEHFTKQIKTAATLKDSIDWLYLIGNCYLELGEEQKAIETGELMFQKLESFGSAPLQVVRRLLAIAWLRLGERTNCILDHTGESCIFPIRGRGIQSKTEFTEKAIALYREVLANNPGDMESRWLLNVAYMAIGRYPVDVPAEFLIAGLADDDSIKVQPFADMAADAGLNINNMAGGSVVDDFNNDGLLDVITTGWDIEEPMHYFVNKGDGTFRDVSRQSGLNRLTGGLNMIQTDYNNDGLKDLFVLRGAWLRNFGEQPNSLIRNNGDGTFTDVTRESGLLSFHPSHSATWADFNNDGWLDVFVGNECTVGKDNHPSQLYISNRNGTFSEMTRSAGIDLNLFVKGVTSGDYDNDDNIDIFVSTLDGKKILLRNEGVRNGVVRFRDVSDEAGVSLNPTPTFTTWFFDYDNDGLLDILCTGYNFDRSLAWYAAEQRLYDSSIIAGKVFIYHNNGNGTFREVSEALGLDKLVFAMGSNFGDINNDGYFDMYFGTGNPVFQSLIPNKMFINLRGEKFADVSASSRLGNLQKGHGTAFADMDADGDQDIFIDMGGAYPGDAYQSSLYVNPGQNENGWLRIVLEGKQANRAAIGAKIKLTFAENGSTRTVYRELNSGGSFGANPLMQHIGVGKAANISELQIKWPGSKTVQVFNNIKANQQIIIREGEQDFSVMRVRTFRFSTRPEHGHSGH